MAGRPLHTMCWSTSVLCVTTSVYYGRPTSAYYVLVDLCFVCDDICLLWLAGIWKCIVRPLYGDYNRLFCLVSKKRLEMSFYRILNHYLMYVVYAMSAAFAMSVVYAMSAVFAMSVVYAMSVVFVMSAISVMSAC